MKVCFTGGGTAGHVFPIFPVDAELAQRAQDAYERFWIGTTMVQEKQWVLKTGMVHYGVATGKLRRYMSWRIVVDAGAIIIGLFQCLAILLHEQPDVVFSKGGYASVPTVFAAWLLHIPAITHESDTTAGLATRINGRFVRFICLPFEEARQSLPVKQRKKGVVTGIPIRFSASTCDGKRARKMLSIDEQEPLVVVLGGSSGALQINTLVWERLDELTDMACIVHQMGSATYRQIVHKNYHGFAFVDDGFGDILHAATLVVSRAGATTIAELTELAKPMILIPLGSDASRGDQIANARRMENAGAAVVIPSGEATGDNLVTHIRGLLANEKRRMEMTACLRLLSVQEAHRRIADLICESAGNKGGF